MSLLSASDRETIAAVIAEVEARTAGEIVVTTVGQSDSHARLRAPLAAVTASFLVAVGALLFGWTVSVAIVGQLVLSAGLYVLFGLPAMVRMLVADATLVERAEARAYQLFSELGVHRTVEGSGILIMISEAEHRVVILADYGINARVDDHEWTKHVDAIVGGIREGRAASVVVDEVRALGELLAREFPPGDTNPNQLPNAVEHRDR